MGRRPLRYTRTDPSFPYTTLFRSGLQNLMQKHQCIGDVRGRGLLLGVEFIPHGGQSATAITSKVTDTALELGVSANITGAYRSEEHTSELQSLMRISYAVFCLKQKKQQLTMYPHI